MAMLRGHSNNSNIRLPEVPPESAGFRCETSPLDGDCELPISAVIFAAHGDTTQPSSAELTRSRANTTKQRRVRNVWRGGKGSYKQART